MVQVKVGRQSHGLLVAEHLEKVSEVPQKCTFIPILRSHAEHVLIIESLVGNAFDCIGGPAEVGDVPEEEMVADFCRLAKLFVDVGEGPVRLFGFEESLGELLDGLEGREETSFLYLHLLPVSQINCLFFL